MGKLEHISQLVKARQGGPLSPLIFDLDVDILAVLVKRAQGGGFAD
jgi:hypothetical protein